MKRTGNEAPHGASKKRRRVLKYPCIGEDWGEPEVNSPSGEQLNTRTTPPDTGSSLGMEPEEKGGGAQKLLQPRISGYFTPDRVPLRGGEELMSSELEDQPRGRSPRGMVGIVPKDIVLAHDGMFVGHSDSTGMVMDSTSG